MTTTFDLIETPWIPVLRSGCAEEVSLRDALVHAHEIDALAVTPMTVAVAVLRQAVLPVLLDALGAPRNRREWADRYRMGRFEEEAIDRYLTRHRNRFDLFHDTQPFAQVAGLRANSGEVKSTALLMPAVASGNSLPLFSVHTEAESIDLTPAEAARWLLHTHCWDTAAIKTGADGDPKAKGGKTTGNPRSPLGAFGVVVPTGRTLFETLLLNTSIVPDGLAPTDRPAWRHSPAGPTWQERSAHGLLDLLTWQSRRIRLFLAGDVVRGVVVAAGDRLTTTPEYEPHTLWRIEAKPKAGAPPRRPNAHHFGRAAWQGLNALVVASSDQVTEVETSTLLTQIADLVADALLPEDLALGVETVGVRYGNQMAVVEEVSEDRLPLPIVALRADEDLGEFVERLATDTSQLVRALDRLQTSLRRTVGADPIPWGAGEPASAALVPRLDPLVRRLLTGLQGEPHRLPEAERAWVDMARRSVVVLANEMLEATPPRTVVGNKVHEPLAVMERRFWGSVDEVLPRPDEHEEQGA